MANCPKKSRHSRSSAPLRAKNIAKPGDSSACTALAKPPEIANEAMRGYPSTSISAPGNRSRNAASTGSVKIKSPMAPPRITRMRGALADDGSIMAQLDSS